MVGLTAKNTWKKKNKSEKKKLTNKCPSKERKKFQSTAMKISVNDTQVVTKNVWISRIIIQEKPPHKKSMPVTQHFQPCCEDSLSQQKLNCQLNSLGAGDTPVQTFYPERETERESRLPEWNTNQQVDIEGFLHLYSPVLILFTITS